jgi:hypothetical protein
MHGWTRRGGLFAALLSALGACVDLRGLSNGPRDAPGDVDGGDPSSKTLASSEGGDDAATPTVYGDFTDSARWSTFDLANLPKAPHGFVGGAFDGRYVYLAPYADSSNHYTGHVVRYDTTAPFSDATSWRMFDATTVHPYAQGFIGAAFDGRHVYFVPHEAANDAGPFYNSVVLRFDSHGTFDDPSAWSTFDAATLDGNARFFSGAIFDGRYLHFAPGNLGRTARFDTQGDFANAAAWSIASDYVDRRIGGTFDGQFIYYAHAEALGSTGVIRYDTKQPFTSPASWTRFATDGVASQGAGPVSFGGSAFDGEFVYFSPANSNNTPYTLVTRFDPSGSFADAGSWSTFDVATLDKTAGSFLGAVFDGRFVHFVPSGNGAPSIAMRYDTSASFADPAAWQKFDTTTINAYARSFFGGVFDGRFVYYVPSGGPALVVRFDAKTPPSLPVRSNASFL